jgi:uncharacterized protein (DUF779 family)
MASRSVKSAADAIDHFRYFARAARGGRFSLDNGRERGFRRALGDLSGRPAPER